MQRAPIFKLDEDLLWRIFIENADMQNDNIILNDRTIKDPRVVNNRALMTAQYTSQVCTRWRNLILKWPSIWGKLVDLELLSYATKAWREEVLRRTGTALLSVKGYISDDQLEPWRTFCLSLLSDSWPRIRQLDLMAPLRIESHQQQMLEIIRGPATHMESFKLEFQPYIDLSTLEWSSSNEQSVFAGNAPALRVLRMNNIPFNPEASYISQLRNLHLIYPGHCSRPLRLEELYRMLIQMPFLESLKLLKAIDWQSDPHHASQRIHLPVLQEIILHDNPLTFSIGLLDLITPQAGCSLSLTGKLTREEILLDQDTLLPLSRCVHDYFSTHNITRLLMVILSAGGHQFFIVAHKEDNIPLDRSSFLLQIRTIIPEPGDNPITPHLSKVLSSRLLETITFLELREFRGHSAVAASSHPIIPHLMSPCVAVDTLKTDLATLNILHNIPNATSMFPRLSMLIVDEGEHSSASQITPFLSSRRDAAVPLKGLKFTVAIRSQLKNFGYLEEFTGLNVQWNCADRQGEYLCGSGHPEELDLNVHFGEYGETS